MLNQAKPFINCLEQQLNHLEDHFKKENPDSLSINAMSTGFNQLDQITGGLKQGLYVIAGSSEMRTDFLQRNMVELASLKEGKRVLHFECNLNESEFTNFLLSSMGRIDIFKMSRALLEDDDWNRLCAILKLLTEGSKLHLCDCAGITTEQLEEQVRLLHEEGGLSLISINSLHNLRLPHKTDNRYNEMAEISRFLKELSKKYEVPVVVTASINRRIVDRVDKRPLLFDLRDTGTISDDADVIMFCYRDEVYHHDTEHKGLAEIIVAKNISGPIGTVRLGYQFKYSRFDNVTF